MKLHVFHIFYFCACIKCLIAVASREFQSRSLTFLLVMCWHFITCSLLMRIKAQRQGAYVMTHATCTHACQCWRPLDLTERVCVCECMPFWWEWHSAERVHEFTLSNSSTWSFMSLKRNERNNYVFFLEHWNLAVRPYSDLRVSLPFKGSYINFFVTCFV